jgi:cell division protein FtsB
MHPERAVPLPAGAENVSHRSVASLRAGVAIEVDAMVERIEDLEAEVAHLKKENASLWETVHDLQDKRESA